MVNRGGRPLEDASLSLVKGLIEIDQIGQEFDLECGARIVEMKSSAMGDNRIC